MLIDINLFKFFFYESFILVIELKHKIRLHFLKKNNLKILSISLILLIFSNNLNKLNLHFGLIEFINKVNNLFVSS